jgi:PAS domain S-box-containing protein
MVAHIDSHHRYIFTNRPYAEFFGRSEKNIIGYRLDEVVGIEIAERLSVAAKRVLNGERVELEIALYNHQDDLRLMQAIFVPDVDSSGSVCAYVAMFQDITERKQADAKLAHKVIQLELLNQVGQNLSGITSISEVLYRSVQLVQESFNYQSIFIFLMDESFKELALMAKAGIYSDTFPDDMRIQPGVGFIGWVAAQAKTRLTNNVDTDPVFVRIASADVPTLSELCVPIVVDAQVIGVIDVQSPHVNAFDDSDVLVMQTMAEQIGISIENARLHTAAKQQIAERKRTEELLQTALQDKEALLREVHHRVKNNMQVIASMLNLRAEKVTDPRALQAFQDCQNSISAIASVHKSLYESSGQSSIRADEYFHNLIERLKISFDDKSSRITHHTAIEPIILDFDSAIPCGLVLNELLTNVYKYAFPANRSTEQDCKVDISLSEKDAKIYLAVSDNGTGFPEDFEDRKSQALGLQLTELLVKQLKGRLTMGGDKGVTIEVVFPSPCLKSGGRDVGSTNSGGR